ncbi:hypothetical protein FRB95_013740 [Tulasnella sp. JGI-2019a]|nr:hypothetical protein FRB95_013740 [Tulasnella sp. JGI-2019a]
MPWRVSIHSPSLHRGSAFGGSGFIVIGAYFKNVGRRPKSKGGWVRWILARGVGPPSKPYLPSLTYLDTPNPRTLPRFTPLVLKMCWGASGTRIVVMRFDERYQNIKYPTVLEGLAYDG